MLLLDFPYTKTVLTIHATSAKVAHETTEAQTSKKGGNNPEEEYYKEKLTELLSKVHENELIWLVHRLSLKNDRQVDHFFTHICEIRFVSLTDL